MTPAEKTNLLNRAAYFLIDTPSATAQQIAAALNTNVSHNSLARIMACDERFAMTGPRNQSRQWVLSAGAPLVKPDEAAPPTEPATTPLNQAIMALRAPMVELIMGAVHTEVERITDEEIKSAIETAQKNIKSRLCDVLLFDGLIGSPTASNDAKVYVDPAAPQQKKEQNAFPASKAPTPPKSAPKPFEFTNPPGAPVVTNDLLSKRTSHKSKGLAAPKPSAPAAETNQPQRPPKMVIVGLHDNKQELIRREFRDKFTLCMFNPDRIRAIQDCINPGDDVILMANYVSHSHQSVVEKAGGKEYIVHGGIPSLRDELNERYEARNKDVEKAA